MTDNRIIIACAGSGKTTRLVSDALVDRDFRIALVTYTNNNRREICKRFCEKNSGIPKHVDVMTWFEFLLRECARPYQRAKYTEKRIESLLFVNQQSTRGVKEADTKRYYFTNGELIYSDKIAQFVVECEEKSSKAVTRRLRQLYTAIFIDEFQDLAGWDLEVIKMLMQSGIQITLVGDPRQHIYSTNPSPKNKQYIGIKALNLVTKWVNQGLCEVDYMSSNYRCCSEICDFSNALWPDIEDRMTSSQHDATNHDGVFLVAENVVSKYVQYFKPQILRHDRKSNTYGFEAVNFGLSKGLQFDRVLIVPTNPIKNYLKTGSLCFMEKAREKLHVAVTRARHSVAFVCDEHSPIVPNRWNPEHL